LEEEHPDTYQQILNQEADNYQHYGVSNAMAQTYYHLILPLANRRDKQTQIRWGIREYQFRFQHSPQGLWLPETAVDWETLELLAEEGIQFTILAPWQAAEKDSIFRQPCRLELPNSKQLNIFYYDASLSGQVSFYPPATRNATQFVQTQVLPAYLVNDGSDQLILIASDGELYGHHQRFRDKFLSYLLDGAANEAGLDILFPARWLQSLPVEAVTSILPNTSWSCHHGIERWRGVCADAPLASWKEPLRYALERLAKAIDDAYAKALEGKIREPWKLRDDYIQVLLNQKTAEDLIREHLTANIPEAQIQIVDLLLKAQDHRMKMFASDAWFYEDFNRIEPYNAIRYAVYAAWLTIQTGAAGMGLFDDLKNDLRPANSLDGKVSGDSLAVTFWESLQKEKIASIFPA